MFNLPPEVKGDLQDIARVLAEHNPAPNADEVTRAQVLALADMFQGQSVYINKQAALASRNEQIRREYLDNVPVKQIARKLGVHHCTIQRIIKR